MLSVRCPCCHRFLALPEAEPPESAQCPACAAVFPLTPSDPLPPDSPAPPAKVRPAGPPIHQALADAGAWLQWTYTVGALSALTSSCCVCQELLHAEASSADLLALSFGWPLAR